MERTEQDEVFVAVDLRKEEVVAISRRADVISRLAGPVILRGRFSGRADGLIYLAADSSSRGSRATKIALASRGVGLGWTFATEAAR